jgi:hypothetical protein
MAEQRPVTRHVADQLRQEAARRRQAAVGEKPAKLAPSMPSLAALSLLPLGSAQTTV